jgi:hypothetical protein
MRRDLVSTPQPVDVDRVIYATITLMSVLIIYDGWQQLRVLAVVGVIVGPVLAMFLAHVFSASLAQELSLGKPVTMAGRMEIVRSESRFLLLCVPPVLLVGVLVPLGGLDKRSDPLGPCLGHGFTRVLGRRRRTKGRTDRVAPGAGGDGRAPHRRADPGAAGLPPAGQGCLVRSAHVCLRLVTVSLEIQSQDDTSASPSSRTTF